MTKRRKAKCVKCGEPRESKTRGAWSYCRDCRPMCQHCHKSRAARPRGLCWACYYKPGVRDQYAPVKFARTREISEENRTFERLRMPVPTRALPGTAEKVAVLAARARRGQHLFHSADAKYTVDETIPTRRRTRSTGSR